jgi:hypothetical protein
MEKPERLKKLVKKSERLITMKEMTEAVDAWITGWYNKQPHQGDCMYGKTPDQVYAENLTALRTVTSEQLDELLMRYSQPMTVSKNGVTLTFWGMKLQYQNLMEMWKPHFGDKVLVRYKPEDLRTVRICDLKGRFICGAELIDELPFIGASKDDIAKYQRANRGAVRALAQDITASGRDRRGDLAAFAGELADRSDEVKTDPKLIEVLAAGELMPSDPDETLFGVKPSAEVFDWSSAI